jgi:hypothetical protein
MANFTEKDVGKMFTLVRVGEDETTKHSFFCLRPTAEDSRFDRDEKMPALEIETNLDIPLMYLGKKHVSIRCGSAIGGNSLAGYATFLHGEKIVGLPEHLYDISSVPIIFVECGEKISPSTIRHGDYLPGRWININERNLVNFIAKYQSPAKVPEKKESLLEIIKSKILAAIFGL